MIKKFLLSLAACSLLSFLAGPVMAGETGPAVCADGYSEGQKVTITHTRGNGSTKNIRISACDEDYDGMPDCVEHKLCHGDVDSDCPTTGYTSDHAACTADAI